ncbi:MAG: hypothetical protein QOE08_1798 [Thermoleophilaceae bacterium]|jgi:hypothetical protein|nr:hypothetical protein [Thermoleophilaceae bacterium]
MDTRPDAMDFDARLDLSAALVERERTKRRFEGARGTEVEVDAFVDLHAANVRVIAREKFLAWSERSPLEPYPHPAHDELAEYELCDECAASFGIEPGGTSDPVQYGLGSAPSARLAAELNRERALGGEPRICEAPEGHAAAVV